MRRPDPCVRGQGPPHGDTSGRLRAATPRWRSLHGQLLDGRRASRQRSGDSCPETAPDLRERRGHPFGPDRGHDQRSRWSPWRRQGATRARRFRCSHRPTQTCQSRSTCAWAPNSTSRLRARPLACIEPELRDAAVHEMLQKRGAPACVGKLREVLVYQPASRYWAFQWSEMALFIGLSLILTVLCSWWLRRRIS
jgi:hypothetical protein